jgi:hypothetical protein
VDIEDALAYVCAHADEIREVPGAAGPLDRIRAGDEPVAELDRLHVALRRAGDAPGVYGAIERGLFPAGVPRHAIPATEDTVYLCPDGTCSRYWLPRGADEPPRCGLYERALRRNRL